MNEFAARFPTLFETGCYSCPAGDVCPGDVSSPCGCVRRGAARFECDSCHVLCRLRGILRGLERDEDFVRRLTEGMWFDDLAVEQRADDLELPLLVPLRTRSMGRTDVACFSAVGFDLQDLVTNRSKRGTVSETRATTGVRLRDHVGASKGVPLLAVLNGDDDRLEGFWGMDRPAFLQSLKAQGVVAVTGPTFSVYDDEPASHRTLMMMRHIKVLDEIGRAGLVAIPNLYWRGEYDIKAWAAWLRVNATVRFVSRDFSRTKKKAFRAQFANLRWLLRLVGRPVHVVLVGVGAGRAVQALSQLEKDGHSVTVATASPIVMARRGVRLVVEGGKMKERKDTSADPDDLAFDNIDTFRQRLRVASRSDAPPLFTVHRAASDFHV